MATGAIKKRTVTTSTVICRGPCKFYGVHVVVAASAASIQVRDAVAAAAGTIIDALPASAAIGVRSHPPHPIACDTGLVLDMNGATGTIVVLYEGQD